MHDREIKAHLNDSNTYHLYIITIFTYDFTFTSSFLYVVLNAVSITTWTKQNIISIVVGNLYKLSRIPHKQIPSPLVNVTAEAYQLKTNHQHSALLQWGQDVCDSQKTMSFPLCRFLLLEDLRGHHNNSGTDTSRTSILGKGGPTVSWLLMTFGIWMKLAAQDSVNPGKEENNTTVNECLNHFLLITLSACFDYQMFPSTSKCRIQGWVMSFWYLSFEFEVVGHCRTVDTFVMIVDINYGIWC